MNLRLYNEKLLYKFRTMNIFCYYDLRIKIPGVFEDNLLEMTTENVRRGIGAKLIKEIFFISGANGLYCS